jgi:Domain of Unknown Function (DUF1080)
MNPTRLFILVTGLLVCNPAFTQQRILTPDADPENWTVYNREVRFENDVIHLNAGANDGLLWLNNSDFLNGTIELDIKGKNSQGQSFVGVAFHGADNSKFDAVYFRPFNFKNPQRSAHSIQYVSIPGNDWLYLRTTFPGKYENQVIPVPEPDNWFHVKILVNYPDVKVYVNDSDKPSLEIEQISTRKEGKVGLWVGNGSEGWFRNLKIENQ